MVVLQRSAEDRTCRVVEWKRKAREQTGRGTLMKGRCLKAEVLRTISQIYDAAEKQYAQELEIVISIENGFAKYYTEYNGICKDENGDLNAEEA